MGVKECPHAPGGAEKLVVLFRLLWMALWDPALDAAPQVCWGAVWSPCGLSL